MPDNDKPDDTNGKPKRRKRTSSAAALLGARGGKKSGALRTPAQIAARKINMAKANAVRWPKRPPPEPRAKCDCCDREVPQVVANGDYNYCLSCADLRERLKTDPAPYTVKWAFNYIVRPVQPDDRHEAMLAHVRAALNL